MRRWLYWIKCRKLLSKTRYSYYSYCATIWSYGLEKSKRRVSPNSLWKVARLTLTKTNKRTEQNRDILYPYSPFSRPFDCPSFSTLTVPLLFSFSSTRLSIVVVFVPFSCGQLYIWFHFFIHPLNVGLVAELFWPLHRAALHQETDVPTL